MVNLLRTRAVWSGFTGAPGYTNWYWDYSAGTPTTAAADAGSMFTFFSSIVLHLPSDVSVQIDTSSAVIDSVDGQMIDVVATNVGGAVGADGGAYSAVAGALVQWTTASIANGRIVRGRSFIVPVAGATYDVTGQISDSAQQDFANAAAASLTTTGADPRVIWSRPRAGGPAAAVSPVTGSAVPSTVTYLSSRRD